MSEHQQIQQSKKPYLIFQKQAIPASQTPISNPYSIIQRARINPKSLTHADIMQLQRTIGNRAVGRLLSSIGSSSTAQQATVKSQEILEEEELLQGTLQGNMIERVQRQVAAPHANNTDLPDNLKSGIENLSGYSMDDVKVHYYSDKTSQPHTFASANGSDIHVAPGKEQHLPHEVGQMVHQKQGRVQSMIQMKKCVSINDNHVLEHETDEIGEKAAIGDHKSIEKEGLYNSLSSKLEPIQLSTDKVTMPGLESTEEKNPEQKEEFLVYLLDNILEYSGKTIYEELLKFTSKKLKEIIKGKRKQSLKRKMNELSLEAQTVELNESQKILLTELEIEASKLMHKRGEDLKRSEDEFKSFCSAKQGELSKIQIDDGTSLFDYIQLQLSSGECNDVFASNLKSKIQLLLQGGVYQSLVNLLNGII